jgi:2-dehydro-3-deoxyphosphogluconate aldolase / (4S)-4-hydroxy-2-oxoglutarate aldolase
VTSVLEAISEQVVVPVLRSSDMDDAIATARACAKAGIGVIELTRSTPNVERAIECLTTEDGLSVGLGTVTDHRQIRPAVSAGASFVVSFCAPAAMVDTAHEHDVAAVPGGFTPSELQACLEAGADAVKLFPVSELSPGYVREVRAVMPNLRLMATGGLHATPRH